MNRFHVYLKVTLYKDNVELILNYLSAMVNSTIYSLADKKAREILVATPVTLSDNPTETIVLVDISYLHDFSINLN